MTTHAEHINTTSQNWYFKALEEADRTRHMPRTGDDIVRGMLPVQFRKGNAERARAAINEAVHEMRVADLHRIMGWTGLVSPFARQRRA